MMHMRVRCVLTLLALLALAGGLAGRVAAGGDADSLAALRRQFESPPDDSRIMMRWWWFGPAVTGPEIERELRAMKAAGIGGVEVQAVYPVALDDEARGVRNLPFLSDEFLDALRFASDTARGLGLRFDVTLGSGWPYGGPSVPVAQAAGRLRIVRTPLPPGARELPLPDIGAGEKLIAAFLVSVDGTAGAAPAGAVAPVAATSGAAPAASEVVDIRDGIVRLPAGLTGAQELQVFIASRTGMMVKRAAAGADGFVIDHLDRGALDAYLAAVGERLLKPLAAQPPYAIFSDSLEVFGSDWTGDLLQEFQRRRGYDLRPHLPELAADGASSSASSASTALRASNSTNASSAGLRYDWGLTLTELLNERFLAPMQAWAKRHGTRFRAQIYGMPPAALSSNAFADLADGEGTEWKILSSSRWASSANHLYDCPVTASETWTWLHSPSFRATPLDMKAEADIHFLQGINQLIGHGWPYAGPSGGAAASRSQDRPDPVARSGGAPDAAPSQRGLASAPVGEGYPGWRFYAAGAFSDANPWWIVMPDVSRYLQRVSFLLRQGRPANDVAIYLPTSDAYASFTPGKVHLIDALREKLGTDIMPALLEAGCNVDFVDDEALKRTGRVDGGTLTLGGNRYRAVVLPGVERLPFATLQTLDAFARGGGIVIATRRLPALAPGFRATDADHAAIARLAARLFESNGAKREAAPGLFVRDERTQLADALRRRLQPDAQLAPAAPDVGIVHRHTPDADIYFVANTSNQARRVNATFRVDGTRTAEQWDPMTGRVAAIDVSSRAAGAAAAGATVALDLPPYGSTVIVFPASARAKASGTSTSTAGVKASAPAAMDISGGWNVTFTSASDGRTSSRVMDRLHSWTDDSATHDFSGVATYERTLEISGDLASAIAARRPILLDFGEAKPTMPQPKARFQAWLDAPVREGVVIEINGVRVGAVWSPPYAIDVSSALKPGANQIRLTVGNLAINYMAARPLPDYRLLNLRYGTRFEPQDMNDLRPLPAGLLGPITLKPTASAPGTQPAPAPAQTPR
jgi:hypothetical protein